MANDTMDLASEKMENSKFLIGLARAFGGALLFALPILMTVEIWDLGLYIYPSRLALFLLLALPILIGFSWYSGFKSTQSFKEDIVDAFVAYGVGFCASAIALLLLAIIGRKTSSFGIVSMISLQAVPASMGAVLAQSQFGNYTKPEERKKEHAGYWGEIFLMIAGAVFFAFNLAPFDEVESIAYKMKPMKAAVLAVFSLLLMHALVYSFQFQGENSKAAPSILRAIFQYTIVGYAISLIISLYMLWTFGRTEGLAVEQNLIHVIILTFPSTIGAAVARLIL